MEMKIGGNIDIFRSKAVNATFDLLTSLSGKPLKIEFGKTGLNAVHSKLINSIKQNGYFAVEKSFKKPLLQRLNFF
jgi:hypothetical protein